jgi:hypothetical protein
MSIHEEYMRRIYEPYGYLHTKGVSYLDLKKGERIILFETYEGAVKYFDEYVYHTKYDGTLVLPPNKGVRYVHVEHPGKYTAVNLAVADFSHTLYGNFHIVHKTHPTHGQYVGWAYLQKRNEIDNSNSAYTSDSDC